MLCNTIRPHKLDIVRMRLKQGFYFRPEVLEVIAHKIVMEWEREETKS